MKINTWINEAIELNRKNIEKAFDAAETVHGKTEEYTGKALEQAQLVPEQGKELVRNWIEEGRRLRREFREAVLKGHERLGELITAA